MSKYDSYLTEVVYEIDDLIYDFYRESNEIIAAKRNQDRLLEFRDKTITTLNDMNVRSLEIIAQFKDHQMVERRVDVLIEKNQSILASALTVINSDHTVGNSVKDIMNSAVDGARKVYDKVSDPETVDKIKSATQDGIDKVKDTIHNVAEDQRFIDGVEKTKGVAKDVVAMGSDALRLSSQKLKDWLDSRKADEDDDVEGEENEESHDL